MLDFLFFLNQLSIFIKALQIFCKICKIFEYSGDRFLIEITLNTLNTKAQESHIFICKQKRF